MDKAKAGAKDPECVMFKHRIPDVVRILGRDLPTFLGKCIPSIRLLAYRSDRWVSIVFQVDEKNTDGAFLFPNGEENDLSEIDDNLDEQDEIVFLARDAGCRAPSSAWPGDSIAGEEIEITDPLTGEKGWSYLFAFSDPPPLAPDDLISYDPEWDRISSRCYVAGYSRIKGRQSAVNESYLVPKECGGNGRNFFDSAKGWIRLRLLFSLLKITIHSDNFLSSVPAYIDGPVRVVIKKRTAIKLGPGLRSPHIDSDLIYYPRFFMSGLVIAIPFDPSLVTSSLRLTIGTDLNHEATGMLFWNSRNLEPAIVDGRMSPQEIALDIRPDQWRVVFGDQGKYLGKAVYAGNFRLSNIKLDEGRYVDDFRHSEKPENEPGIYGSYNWTWDITNGKKGKYVVWIEAHYGGRIEGPEDVADCLNVTDNPLRVRIGQREMRNCLLIPPPGFGEQILPEMYRGSVASQSGEAK